MKNFPKKAAAASEIIIVICAAILFFSAIYRKNIMESFGRPELFFDFSLETTAFIYAAFLIETAANLLVYMRKTKLAPIVMSAAAAASAFIYYVSVRMSRLELFDASYFADKCFDLQQDLAAETANAVFFLFCAAALTTVCGAVYALTENKDTAGNNFAAAAAEKI